MVPKLIWNLMIFENRFREKSSFPKRVYPRKPLYSCSRIGVREGSLKKEGTRKRGNYIKKRPKIVLQKGRSIIRKRPSKCDAKVGVKLKEKLKKYMINLWRKVPKFKSTKLREHQAANGKLGDAIAPWRLYHGF